MIIMLWIAVKYTGLTSSKASNWTATSYTLPVVYEIYNAGVGCAPKRHALTAGCVMTVQYGCIIKKTPHNPYHHQHCVTQSVKYFF